MLTPGDAKQLRGKIQDISNLLDKARADSVIDNGEAQTIDTMLSEMSEGLKQRGISAAPTLPGYAAGPTVGFGQPTFAPRYEFGSALGAAGYAAPNYGPAWGQPTSALWGAPAPYIQ